MSSVSGRARPWRMLIVVLAWGSCFPLLKWGLSGQSLPWFMAWRAGLAGLVLLMVGATTRRRRLSRSTLFTPAAWGVVVALAVLNVAVAYAAMAASLSTVTAAVATVLGNAQALLVVLPAWWLFAERPRVREVTGVAAGLGGLVLMAGATPGRGAEWALLSAAAIAGGALLARRVATVDVLLLGAGQFLIGAVVLAVLAAVTDGWPTLGWSARSVAALIILAVVGTAVPYVLWFSELRRASLVAVTSWTLLVPVAGVIASVAVLAEPMTMRQWVGSAVVFAALAVIAWSGRAGNTRLTRWQRSSRSNLSD